MTQVTRVGFQCRSSLGGNSTSEPSLQAGADRSTAEALGREMLGGGGAEFYLGTGCEG